jgi:hypothetical protein
MTIRFVLSGVLIGVVITVALFSYQKYEAYTHDQYSEVSIASNVSDVVLLEFDKRGFRGNVIFSVLYHLRENEIDKAKKVVLAIDDELHRLSIVESLARRIYQKVYPEYRRENEELKIDDKLAKEFASKLLDILAEVEPKSPSNEFMDALQLVIKLLDVAEQKELAANGIEMLDNHINGLTPIFNKMNGINASEEKYEHERETFNNKTNVAAIGVILTSTLGAIGFVLSALLGPVFRMYGEEMAKNLISKNSTK